MSQTDARAARAAFERLLGTHAPALASLLPPGFGDAAERYVELLLDANERLNLTRVVEPESVALLHLLDAVSALPVIDRRGPGRAVDLGSGGGVPGIPLAVARPETAWVLVESVGKKATALRGFIDALGLANVIVRSDRAENLGRDPEYRERVDLVTARACAPLPVLVEYALPLVRMGGALLAWKGVMGDEELTAGTVAAAELGGAEPRTRDTGIAALGGHRLLEVEKVGTTADRYPRRPGVPSRRPLGR